MEYTQEDLFSDIEDYRKAEQEHLQTWEKAVKLALAAHAGQTRDEGTPYYDHVYRVALRVIKMHRRADKDAVIAILHDVLEDTVTTPEDLRREFGQLVADGVQQLTKDKAAPGYSLAGYLESIARNEDDYMIPVIKMLDRIDNVRSLDMCPDEQKKARYMQETREIFIPIFQRYHRNKDTYNKVLTELEQLAI